MVVDTDEPTLAVFESLNDCPLLTSLHVNLNNVDATPALTDMAAKLRACPQLQVLRLERLGMRFYEGGAALQLLRSVLQALPALQDLQLVECWLSAEDGTTTDLTRLRYAVPRTVTRLTIQNCRLQRDHMFQLRGLMAKLISLDLSTNGLHGDDVAVFLTGVKTPNLEELRLRDFRPDNDLRVLFATIGECRRLALLDLSDYAMLEIEMRPIMWWLRKCPLGLKLILDGVSWAELGRLLILGNVKRLSLLSIQRTSVAFDDANILILLMKANPTLTVRWSLDYASPRARTLMQGYENERAKINREKLFMTIAANTLRRAPAAVAAAAATPSAAAPRLPAELWEMMGKDFF